MSETIAQPKPPPLDPACVIDYSEIVTEDDTPVDNTFSEKQQRLLAEPLHTSWSPADGGPFVAMANVGLFFAIKEPPVVPDMMLSLGTKHGDDLWEKRHRSYFVWEHGKPPDVVVEVVSNREGGEADQKRDLYARIGVHYYVVFDPERLLGPAILRVLRLYGGRYRAVRGAPRFPEFGLGLTLWRGKFEGVKAEWLRWCQPDGRLIPTGAERSQRAERRADRADQRAEVEAQRADLERSRAEAETQRAEAEAQRADRLAAKLRKLGVDPDA